MRSFVLLRNVTTRTNVTGARRCHYVSLRRCYSCCSQGNALVHDKNVSARWTHLPRTSFYERQWFRLNSSTTVKDEDLVSIATHFDIIQDIPLEDIRNFCFIAHVDHGKSSLASRVLELTGNLGPQAQARAMEYAAARDTDDNTPHSTDGSKENIELLDTLQVEKQRGITVKASAATMLYKNPKVAKGPTGFLLLNMVDTPGHVDFGKEVSRSLDFVQGAVLLLDATQGIQAQTWNVHEKVTAIQERQEAIFNNEHGLELLVALTKVDLEMARPIHVALSVSEWLSWDDPDSIVWTSARNRIGIANVLDAVCEQVPSPPVILDKDDTTITRAQVVDSWFDPLKGVECLVQILSGTMSEGDRIAIVTPNQASDNQSLYSIQEIGLLLPHAFRTRTLVQGQMGYVRFGLRDPRQAQPGTVLVDKQHANLSLSALIPSNLSIQDEAKTTTSTTSVLYATVHPTEADGFDELCHAVEKLALNDTGLEVSKKSLGSSSDKGNSGGGPFLGPGLRVGFQGLLHVEVFRQRLLDEFGLDAVVTPPKVPYTITMLPSKNNNINEPYTYVVEDLSDWPQQGSKFTIQEPIVHVRIVSPMEYAGSIMELIKKKRGHGIHHEALDEETWVFTAIMPWGEVVTNFHNDLKTATAGYGSVDTTMDENDNLQEASLSKVDIMLNGEAVEPLSFVCDKGMAQSEGRVVCLKLKQVLPRQQFVTVIQAKADGRIIASERIQAHRKNVLVTGGSKSVGGGDVTRKKKLLEKQKRGKKRQQATGKVTLSQAAFNSVITRGGGTS